MIKIHINIFFLLLLVFLYSSCAKMGSVSGGPKDEDPPEVTGSVPLNYSTGFKGKRIEISFNEFIVLNNVNQALVISPPLKGKPDVRLKGKSLQIVLEGDLLENTTYTLNFGNSIEDNNERNVLENFEFVFSTGDYLDSLAVSGRILEAFTMKPSKEPFVIMAYDKLEDSIPLKESPVYIGRSDQEGKYRINNMKADTFRIFAIKDLNFNYRFDLPNEMIAFADSFVFLFPELLEKYDPAEAMEDSLAGKINPEKIEGDSLRVKSKLKEAWFKPVKVDLLFFEEDNRVQYLTDNERKEDRQLFVSFNLPMDTGTFIKGLNFEEREWYLEEISAKRDSFIFWVKDSLIYSMDTLLLEVRYPTTDSVGNAFIKNDTIHFTHRKIQEARGKEDEVSPRVFKPSTISNKSTLDINKRILFRTDYPVWEVDRDRISLFYIPDSTEVPAEFTFNGDSRTMRKFYLDSKWKSKGNYRLYIEPGAMKDIYGNSSDTTDIEFSIQDEEYYGVLYVTTSNVKCPVIVQLMNEKEVLLSEEFIDKDGKASFSYLKPGKYVIKYIYDTNNNRKWDTGKYMEKLQPEKVEYYKGEINIRSNWELEIKWELSVCP